MYTVFSRERLLFILIIQRSDTLQWGNVSKLSSLIIFTCIEL